MRRRLIWLLIAALVAALAGAVLAFVLGGRGGKLTLSCVIFSGGEDPEVQVSTAAGFDALRARVQGLPSAPVPTWPQFGFRGVLIVNDGVSDFPPLVRVFDGTIEVQAGRRVTYFRDDKGLEQLVSSGAPEVPDPCEPIDRALGL